MGELDPRIRIRAPLRCDGIGRLDCAEDTVSGERLAVRWLPLEANGDAAVKACEKLPSHPALPRILQTGHVGASAFVALDFPQGELLSARGEEPLDQRTWLRLAADLSDALATVHEQGVVHGEMSRDSVLLADDGKASLWDMPLVIANRLSDRRGENRLMQNLVKTASYLAPERARGDGATRAGDVYALGAILCISGGAPRPAAGSTLGAVHLVASGEYRPRVPDALPEHLAALLTRMVALDPAERPTARDVAQAFAQAPTAHMLPTMPELAAVRLPPEILAAADALMKQQVEALRAPPAERPLAELQPVLAPGATAAVVEALPLASDPLPALTLAPPLTVQAHTLDAVSEPEPEVVRIPTLELRAVLAEAAAATAEVAPVPAAPIIPTVPLNDAISVAPDLLAAGAGTLSEDELAAVRVDTRRLGVLLAVLAGGLLALLTVAITVAVRTPDAPTPAAPARPAVTPSAAQVTPVQARVPPVEDPTPLPKLQKATTPKAAPAPRAEAPAAVEPTPALEVAAAPAKDPAPAAAASPAPAPSFDLLDPAAEPPRNELKRPSEF